MRKVRVAEVCRSVSPRSSLTPAGAAENPWVPSLEILIQAVRVQKENPHPPSRKRRRDFNINTSTHCDR